MQVYSNTPETINLIIEVFVEVAHKQICYLGEVSEASLMYVHTHTHTVTRYKKKHTDEGKTCKLHAERPLGGRRVQTQSLLNDCTTVPPDK